MISRWKQPTVIAVSVAIGALLARVPWHRIFASRPAHVLQTERLEIVDNRGKVRAVLGCEQNGDTKLELRTPTGNKQAILIATEQNGVLLQMYNQAGNLVPITLSTSGGGNISVSNGDPAHFAAVSLIPGIGFDVMDSNGHVSILGNRVTLSDTKDASKSVILSTDNLIMGDGSSLISLSPTGLTK